jgi:hypothetical protein
MRRRDGTGSKVKARRHKAAFSPKSRHSRLCRFRSLGEVSIHRNVRTGRAVQDALEMKARELVFGM